ncbi:hypothetical protein BC749_106318 [Flavobacterium araucananum]|nr:hypothetical protein BC749_106318 [Flavobacterium araucananum]
MEVESCYFYTQRAHPIERKFDTLRLAKWLVEKGNV